MKFDDVEIKAFVPAFDFAKSKAIYQTLGFDMTWSPDVLACLRHDTYSA